MRVFEMANIRRLLMGISDLCSRVHNATVLGFFGFAFGFLPFAIFTALLLLISVSIFVRQSYLRPGDAELLAIWRDMMQSDGTSRQFAFTAAVIILAGVLIQIALSIRSFLLMKRVVFSQENAPPFWSRHRWPLYATIYCGLYVFAIAVSAFIDWLFLGGDASGENILGIIIFPIVGVVCGVLVYCYLNFGVLTFSVSLALALHGYSVEGTFDVLVFPRLFLDTWQVDSLDVLDNLKSEQIMLLIFGPQLTVILFDCFEAFVKRRAH